MRHRKTVIFINKKMAKHHWAVHCVQCGNKSSVLLYDTKSPCFVAPYRLRPDLLLEMMLNLVYDLAEIVKSQWKNHFLTIISIITISVYCNCTWSIINFTMIHSGLKMIHGQLFQRPEFAFLNPADTLPQCKYVQPYNTGPVSLCVRRASPASVCVPLMYAAACCFFCAGPCSSSAPCCLTDRLLVIAA